MVISVWNNGYNETTKDFTSLFAAYVSLVAGKSVTLMENEARGELIGHNILGPGFSDALHKAKNSIPSIGAGGTIAKYLANRLNVKNRGDDVLSVVNNGLYYIPQLNDGPSEVFDEYIVDRTYGYIEKGSLISDIVLIDTAKTSNMSTPYILEVSSKVVVIMPDNFYAFTTFFQMYKSIFEKCVFVLFEDRIPRRFIKELKERYGLNASNLFAFRRTDEFNMYKRAGRLMDYIKVHSGLSKDSSEYMFIRELRRLFGYLYVKNVEE